MGLSYKDTVLADGPILFWRLDEAVGTVGTQIADSSVGGTLTGTIKFAVTTPTGSILFNEYYGASPVSGAMFANSATPRILMTASMFAGPGLDVSPTTSFSVEWWEKSLSFSSFNNILGFSNFITTAAAWGWFLTHNDSAGGTYVGIHVGDRFTPTDINNARLGAVYHHVFTYDAAQGIGTFYRNNIKLAQKPMQAPASNFSTANGSPDAVGTITGDAAFGIGDGINGWNGTFDNVAVYNKLLTPDRIQAHYLSGTANTAFSTYAAMTIQDNPTLYYRLSDASGSSPNIKDYSQVGTLNGTLVGGAAGLQFQEPGLINGDADTGLSGTTPGNAPYINTATSTGVGGSGGPFTVMWWQKVTVFPTGSAINNTIGAGFTRFFAGCSGSTGEGFCGIGSGDGFTPRDLPRGFFQTNQVAHYCFTYDGSNYAYIFKNGKLVLWKRMQPSVAWGANGFAVGSGSWSGEYDEVVILNQLVPIDMPLRHYLMGLGTASLPTPTVVSIQSFSGSIYSGSQVLSTGGSYVIVSGSNFQPLVRVYVSGVNVGFLPGIYGGRDPAGTLGTDLGIRQVTPDVIVGLSGSQLFVYAPTGTLGSASISVLNPDGQSATGSNLLFYVTASDDYHATVIADKPSLYWRLDDGSGSYTLPTYVTSSANDVLYWRFDETQAPFSSSGNGSILPMFNHTGSAASGALGIFSGAVAIPGPGWPGLNFVDTGPTGTTLHTLTSNFSVGLWVYLYDYGFTSYNNPAGGAFATFAGKAYRPDASGWTSPFWAWSVQLLDDKTGRLFTQVIVGGVSKGVETNFVVPLKQWCHVGFTYDGTTLTAYGNGANVGTVAGSGLVDYGTNGPYNVGGTIAGGDNMHGLVDDLRISNIVRPSTYWSQFSGSGGPSNVADWSNHGNTGSVYQALPNLLFKQPGLVRSSDPNSSANMAMTNIAADSPVPFVATTGDPNGLAAPPAAGIGSASIANTINSFSAEWWFRRDPLPWLNPQLRGVATHRFGFANNQFLYNVTNNSGQVTVGTDVTNQLTINNFVDPNPSDPPKAHHYCFTFSDAGNGTGTGIMYRDGVNISSNATMRVPTGWQAFEAIGPFSGTFDEVAVYPYALSALQVSNHYSVGQAPPGFNDDFIRQLNTASFNAMPSPGFVQDMFASGTHFISGSVAALPSPGFLEDLFFTGSIPLQQAAPAFFPAQLLPDFGTLGILLQQAIQGAGFLDTQNNVQFLWPFGSGSSEGGGGGGSTPPGPTIQNFSPGIGLPISSGTLISFDIISSTGVVPFFAIVANFGGIPAQDLVYNSVAFNSMYSGASNTITAISGGYHVTMLRDGGWLDGSVTVIPIAFSTGSRNT